MNRMVIIFLIILGAIVLFSTVAMPICIPTSNAQGFQYFCILTNTYYFLLFCFCFYNSHPNGCEGVSHVVLSWNSLTICDVDHLFHILIGNLYIFSGETSIQLLCPFLNWVILSLLVFRSFLYILDINLFSDIWCANIFSHLIGCHFTLLIVSFEAQKFLVFVKSNLLSFSFVVCVFGVIIQHITDKSKSCVMFP